jgi:CBS domain-containing protein
MTSEPARVPAEASLDEAVLVMDEQQVRHLPVVSGREVVGVVSDRDLLELTGWLSKRQREVLEAPSGPVGAHTRKPPITIGPEDDLELALDVLLAERIGCLPVTVEGQLVGMITEMDLLSAYVSSCTARGKKRAHDPPVVECMTRPAQTISVSAPAEEAAELFVSRVIRHLPVVDGERLVGMLSDRDLRLELGRGGVEGLQVGELMTESPLTAAHHARLSTVADQMVRARIGAVPVLEEARLVGILCSSDVLRTWLTALRQGS